jgi:hypothetical protein
MRLHSQGAMALTAGIVVVLALVAGACAPARVDVSTVTPCTHEYGPAPDGPVPCVWDTLTQGVTQPDGIGPGSTASHARWLYYSTDTCPVATVQPATMVECVSRADWSGQ